MLTPEKVALSFVEAINSKRIEDLSDLMTDNHTFIDSDGRGYSGRERMREGWLEYFDMVPDFRIEVEETFFRNDTVILTGIAEGTFIQNNTLKHENEWSVPAAWRVVIEDDRVAVWQLYVNPEPMKKILDRIETA
jgi:ketosteroid isomerase-like protein